MFEFERAYACAGLAVHVFLCVCAGMCACVCLYVCVCVNVSVYVRVLYRVTHLVHAHDRAYELMCVNVRLCVCESVCVPMFALVRLWARAGRTCVHKQACAYARLRGSLFVHGGAELERT